MKDTLIGILVPLVLLTIIAGVGWRVGYQAGQHSVQRVIVFSEEHPGVSPQYDDHLLRRY